jgi:hypothetical protein
MGKHRLSCNGFLLKSENQRMAHLGSASLGPTSTPSWAPESRIIPTTPPRRLQLFAGTWARIFLTLELTRNDHPVTLQPFK